jgi:hypothetical protein
MTTEAVTAPARTRTPGAKWRSFLAAFLVIVAFILTPIGIVGYWAKQTLTDTQQYIDTVGPIGEDPATKAALADFITQKIDETSSWSTPDLKCSYLSSAERLTQL